MLSVWRARAFVVREPDRFLSNPAVGGQPGSGFCPKTSAHPRHQYDHMHFCFWGLIFWRLQYNNKFWSWAKYILQSCNSSCGKSLWLQVYLRIPREINLQKLHVLRLHFSICQEYKLLSSWCRQYARCAIHLVGALLKTLPWGVNQGQKRHPNTKISPQNPMPESTFFRGLQPPKFFVFGLRFPFEM